MAHELVTIRTFLTTHEAELARGFLESEGIDAFLADDAMSRIASHLTPMLGGIKLQVRREDVGEANELLSTAE